MKLTRKWIEHYETSHKNIGLILIPSRWSVVENLVEAGDYVYLLQETGTFGTETESSDNQPVTKIIKLRLTKREM